MDISSPCKLWQHTGAAADVLPLFLAISHTFIPCVTSYFHAPTGFGNMLARPLMREKHRPDMSEEEAVALMQECLKVIQQLLNCDSVGTQ